jgi:hypothetical protein
VDAKPFARELALLPELPLRERKVGERLLELPIDAAVELLHDLVRLAETNDDDARVALLACVGLNRYEKILGYEYLAQLYVSADDKGYADVKRLLATSEAKRKPPRDGRVENEFVEKTLGERKELARVTRDRDLLDRLLFDRNPEVIRALLRNPRVIERDVVKIAAMRPTNPRLLEEILRHERWSSRYVVKKALAQNPYLPTNTAVSLLSYLLSQDLKQVTASLEISQTVRNAARELLARKNGDEEGSQGGLSS